jgi:hypothetical protein
LIVSCEAVYSAPLLKGLEVVEDESESLDFLKVADREDSRNELYAQACKLHPFVIGFTAKRLNQIAKNPYVESNCRGHI